MADHNYRFNVTMACGGCSSAVERVLRNLQGVKSFDVSLKTQTVSVVTEGNVAYETVLEEIKRSGKKINSADADGVAQAV